MRKFYIALICILVFFVWSGNLFAQQQLVTPEKQQRLTTISASARQSFRAGKQQAQSSAKQFNWPIIRKTQKGNLVVLQGVNKLGFPVYLTTHNNAIAAATTRTNALQPGGALGLNLSGSSALINNKLGIWDGGSVYKFHQEFTGKTISVKDNASVVDHSTHVAGTMIARGIYAPAKGMAPNTATLQSWDFDDDVAEMGTAAAGLLLSNHSYGDVAGWDYNSGDNRWEWYGLPGDTVDYNFGFYDSRAQSWDQIAYNAPYYLIVESAGNNRSSNGPAIDDIYYGFASRTNPTFVNKGKRPGNISDNDGYGIIPTTGNAKNILTVGSVGPLPNGPVNRADVSISRFSSWGPTDDGRIKPDLVGDGENVLSTGVNSPTSYFTLSGTSMAAPNITGSLYLLQEYYSQKNGGAFMRSATVKGLACHTAFDAGKVGPDYIYGWGLLDAANAAQTITQNNNTSLISENTLKQGQTKTLIVRASGNGPLTVSIVWTDPEGEATSGTKINDRTPKLVNDLDIRISDGANIFSPWVLDPEKPGLAAITGDNIRDNIEQVFIANAAPGKEYTITVTHKGTLRSGSQDYSLIATGIGGKVYCASAPTSTTDSKIEAFKFSTVNYSAPAGCTGYTDNTSLTARLEQGKTYPINITLSTCGARYDKAAKVFIDWNNNGSFENDELAATTGNINGTGSYTGSITVPLSVVPGNFSRMRLVLVETADTAAIAPCGSYPKGETQDYRVEFLKPQIDVAVTAIVNAEIGAALCAVPTAPVIRLKNNGAGAISNIPVKVTVTSPGGTTVTLSETYNAIIAPGEEEDFTFSNKFNTVAGVRYTITAQAALPGDPISSNNSATANVTIAFPPVVDDLAAYYCVNTGQYQLSGNGQGGLLWYTSPNATLPFAYGNDVMVSQAPVNGTYYAGINDFKGTVGPATKNVFTGGGYNQFTPGVEVTTSIPTVIESARLYVGNSGKVTFSVTNDEGEVVSSSTLNLAATRSNPAAGALPDDAADQGRVYQLNLTLPAAGHYTITPSYDGAATLFRSNAGVGEYPFRIGNIFSITRNNAISPVTENDTTYYRQYYYYFYNMQVKSLGCPSDVRKEVTVTKPVITRDGDQLNSSIATGNQWLLNGKEIDGATGQTFTPLQSGNYSVEVFLSTGCIAQSEDVPFALVAKNPDKSTDIGLTVFPVPANTYLNVLFKAKAADNLKLSLVNSAGQTVYRAEQAIAAGDFSTVVNTANRTPGTYFLKLVLGQKMYSRKIVIAR